MQNMLTQSQPAPKTILQELARFSYSPALKFHSPSLRFESPLSRCSKPLLFALDDGLVIDDRVHGQIVVDRALQGIIDSPVFQRLRDIKQLGLLYLVFVNATHSRFEHSLGTYHLVSRMARYFSQHGLKIDADDILNVSIAALLHDVGHVAFSHTMEDVMQRLGHQWTHESMSLKIIDWMAASGQFPSSANVALIKEYIHPSGKPLSPEQHVLAALLSSSATDMDRLDYLMRDAMNTGKATAFNGEPLLRAMHAIDGKLCFARDAVRPIIEFCRMRRTMHEEVYQHPVAVAVHCMVVDALVLAGGLDFDSVEKVITLKDSILDRIEMSESNSLGIQKAKNIIARVRCRRWYKLVAEAVHSKQSHTRACSAAIGKHIDEQLLLHISAVHFGAGESDPMRGIQFCTRGPDGTMQIDNTPLTGWETISEPPKFILRMYARSSDAKIDVAREIFVRECRQHGMSVKDI
jgi:hypothetical protein